MSDSETSTETSLVSVGPHRLEGILRRPADPVGLVIFAHGAGSSHRSPRNNHVAEALAGRRIATLLFDLLTEAEAGDRANVFDIPLLSRRLIEAVDWAAQRPDLAALPVGLFGASTGAAAALVAAGAAPGRFAAVVSRGGRPDLAGAVLPAVRAPVLLIVGGHDEVVIDLNAAAARRLACPHRTEIVPGATHLFEEPGTLDRVVQLAGDWFATHFAGGGESVG
ncbi:MAG: dienelactone hydrolase family protein [Pseudodonghicola sp.]